MVVCRCNRRRRPMLPSIQPCWSWSFYYTWTMTKIAECLALHFEALPSWEQVLAEVSWSYRANRESTTRSGCDTRMVSCRIEAQWLRHNL